jgi:hypothetical protein
MMKMRWHSFLTAVVLLAPLPLRADSKADAEALFEQGKALGEKGQWNEACPKFEASLKAEAAIGTQYYLADCYERVGRLATAWANFAEAATKAKQTGQAAKAADCDKRANALKPRLSRLTIHVTTPTLPGLEIRRGAELLQPGQWENAMPVDPGTVALSAKAPGKKPWTGSITIEGEGKAFEVTIPALDDAPVDTPPPPLAADAGSNGVSTKTIGLITAGGGLVLTGVGAAFWAVASSKNSAAECDGDSVCANPGQRTSAQHWATAGNVFAVVGGLAVASGIVLWLVAPASKAADGGVGVGVTSNGMLLQGRF